MVQQLDMTSFNLEASTITTHDEYDCDSELVVAGYGCYIPKWASAGGLLGNGKDIFMVIRLHIND